MVNNNMSDCELDSWYQKLGVITKIRVTSYCFGTRFWLL